MNAFEKACWDVESDRDYSLEQENAISFLKDAEIATVTFSQKRYISKIEKLAQKFPDEVQIVHRNKGSIVAHIPVSYIKINKKSVELSDEERQALSERARSTFGHAVTKGETE